MGYKCVGWNEKADGTSTDWTGYIGVAQKWLYTNNVTLYAQWEPMVHNIEFNLNGGYGDFVTLIKNADDILTIPTEIPTKPKCIFKHWNSDIYDSSNGIIYNAGDEYTYTQDGGTITLYAIWINTNKDIHIYSDGSCECIEFIEDDMPPGFYSDGTVHANSFIEDETIYLGKNMVFGELLER